MAINKNSGLAGIAYWINQNYFLRGEDKLDKHSRLVQDLKDWVDDQYDGGRTASLSTEELENKIFELSGGQFRPQT